MNGKQKIRAWFLAGFIAAAPALLAQDKQQLLPDDPQQAMRFARQTIIGAAALLEADDTPASQLRENVTSPKGTTAVALSVLMAADGLEPLIERAVRAARHRSEELGRG